MDRTQIRAPAAPLWCVVLVALGTSARAYASPMAKTHNWVHYWDDPRNVEQAISVGIVVGVIALVVFGLGAWNARKESKRRAASRETLRAAGRPATDRP